MTCEAFGQALFRVIECATRRTAPEFMAQDVANTLWALSIYVPHASRTATTLANILAQRALALTSSLE